MHPIFAFILGLLIGWLVEWVIDWIYWRRRYAELETAAQECQRKSAALEANLSSARDENLDLRARLELLQTESTNLTAQIQQAQQETLISRSQPVALPPAPAPDDLEVINGIGPVIARKLNEVGITTFEQLGIQDADFLRNNLGDLIQRLADEESLLEQARALARQKYARGMGGQ